MNSPKIVIIEWIAASGKTTIQEKLQDILLSEGKTVIAIDELQITKNLHEDATRNIEGSIWHISMIMDKYFSEKVDYILLDRFYFSHIPTLKCSVWEFDQIQKRLNRLDYSVIYPYYKIETIVERIRRVLSHRENEWFMHHFNRIISGATSKQEEDEKIVQYYTNRLNRYEEIWKTMDSRVLRIDVSDANNKEDYEEFMKKIKSFIDSSNF